jgi:hypothetical protein
MMLVIEMGFFFVSIIYEEGLAFLIKNIVYFSIMGIRNITFTNGEYYHVFNRGVDKRVIFNNNE